MLKVTVNRLTSGKSETFYAEEADAAVRLRHEFAEAQPYQRLQDVIQAINEYGEAEVVAVPYRHKPALLPEDYLTHQESEDPWPRQQ